MPTTVLVVAATPAKASRWAEDNVRFLAGFDNVLQFSRDEIIDGALVGHTVDGAIFVQGWWSPTGNAGKDISRSSQTTAAVRAAMATATNPCVLAADDNA